MSKNQSFKTKVCGVCNKVTPHIKIKMGRVPYYRCEICQSLKKVPVVKK